MSIEEEPIGTWLAALASEAPAPGGGAALAMNGAMAAALVGMVARFTLGRPKYAEVEPHIQGILQQSDKAREMLLKLCEADAQAFLGVALAFRLPKGTEEEQAQRMATMQQALTQATEVAVMVAELAHEVLTMANIIAQIGNKSVIVDAGTAAHLCQATISATELNVRDNLRILHDEVHSRALQKRLAAAMDDSETLVESTLEVIQTRMQA
jgi:formiminotetrahydrofolate cyclodeaminase